jgi:hypothetical protein
LYYWSINSKLPRLKVEPLMNGSHPTQKKCEPPNTAPNPIQIPSTVSLCVCVCERWWCSTYAPPRFRYQLWHEEKNLVNKNQWWEPIQQKYKAKREHKYTQPEGKTKTNNQQKLGEDHCCPDILKFRIWTWICMYVFMSRIWCFSNIHPYTYLA